MKLCLLHLDDAFESQPDFVRACTTSGAQEIRLLPQGRQVRLWGKQPTLDDLGAQLKQKLNSAADGPRLTFMGSGDFHHITTFLIDAALADYDEPITLIHFDNHPDWVHFDNGMHCGSWVNRALDHPRVQKIITIGVCSHDLRLPEFKGANLSLLSEGSLELYPYDHTPSRVRKNYGANPSFEQKNGALHWNSIHDFGEQNFIDHLLSRINTKAVYLTIDKDVLQRDDAITNWDQGVMRLPYLLSLIRAISSQHRIIGADVTGDYSQPSYGGTLWTRLSKHAEILMDQPRFSPNKADTANINSAANHALLEVLSEAMG